LKLTKDRWSTEGIVPLSFTLDTPGIGAQHGGCRFQLRRARSRSR
jgi:hypothetical protein